MVRRFIVSKHLLFALLFFATALLVAFTVDFKNDVISSSAFQTASAEDEEGNFVFTATIVNHGKEAIYVWECGFNDLRCSKSCVDLGWVYPGMEIKVDLTCEAGTTPEQLTDSGFYINSNVPGQTGMQTTTSGTPSFPGFTIPSIGGSWSNPNPITVTTQQTTPPITSGTSPGGNSQIESTSGSGIQAGANLQPPEFIDIAGSTTQFDFYINEPNPEVRFYAPPLTSQATLSMMCRFAINKDLSFSQMSSSNSCVVDSTGIATCLLSIPMQGFYTGSFACWDGGNENIQNNNLDMYGTFDFTGPIILGISPSSGTVFSLSTNGVFVTLVTDDYSNCRVGFGSTTLYDLMSMECGEGLAHGCTIPLVEGTNIINFACANRAGDVGDRSGWRYIVGGNPSSGGSGDPSSGGGGDETNPEDPVGGGGGGDDADGGVPPGNVVRDFNHEGTVFQSIIDWFKNLFN